MLLNAMQKIELSYLEQQKLFPKKVFALSCFVLFFVLISQVNASDNITAKVDVNSDILKPGAQTALKEIPRRDIFQDTFEFMLPKPTRISKKKRLKLVATYYNIHKAISIDRDGLEDAYPLLTMDGKSLGPFLTLEDWCRGACEGTLVVFGYGGKATVYNYAGTSRYSQVNCTSMFPGLSSNIRKKIGKARFIKARGTFGDGSRGMMLTPMRSIAVDTRFIPIGTLLYVPVARGVKISYNKDDLRFHDGYFYAADTGSAIKGNVIDVFLGHDLESWFAKFVGKRLSRKFDAFVIEDKKIAGTLKLIHRGKHEKQSLKKIIRKKISLKKRTRKKISQE